MKPIDASEGFDEHVPTSAARQRTNTGIPGTIHHTIQSPGITVILYNYFNSESHQGRMINCKHNDEKKDPRPLISHPSAIRFWKERWIRGKLQQ